MDRHQQVTWVFRWMDGWMDRHKDEQTSQAGASVGVQALVLRSRERAKLLGRLKMAVGKPSWWKESSLNCGSSDQAGTVTHQGLLPSRSPASQPAGLLTFTPGRMLRKGIADFLSFSPLGCLGDTFPQWRDTSRDIGELEFMTPVSQSLDFQPPFFAPVKCRALTLFMRCVSGTSRQGDTLPKWAGLPGGLLSLYDK